MTAPALYRPNPQHFRTGDLVWVKRDDQFIAFTDRDGAMHAKTTADAAQANVEAGKRQALAHSTWTAAERQHIAQWQPDPLHADIWVGHVGIIHIHMGQPWVVDATPDRHQPNLSGQIAPMNPQGVAAQTYAAWLSDTGHTQSHVWHGRVKGLSDAQAETTIDYARSHIGKPYRFLPWGFASGELFYCSELVWCAVRESSGILLDGIASTLRVNWFTPWMAMKSQHIERLYEPPGRHYGP
jgi:cell wall-associated NlpC family hydrolase